MYKVIPSKIKQLSKLKINQMWIVFNLTKVFIKIHNILLCFRLTHTTFDKCPIDASFSRYAHTTFDKCPIDASFSRYALGYIVK